MYRIKQNTVKNIQVTKIIITYIISLTHNIWYKNKTVSPHLHFNIIYGTCLHSGKIIFTYYIE